jgi:hypothetical protein
MNDTTRASFFISVLSASAGTGEPFNAEIAFFATEESVVGLDLGVNDGDRDRRGMDAPTAFRWWNSLYPCSTGFLV